jgi:hypothetical protein
LTFLDFHLAAVERGDSGYTVTANLHVARLYILFPSGVKTAMPPVFLFA